MIWCWSNEVGVSSFQSYRTPAIERKPPKQRLWCWSPEMQQPLWPPIDPAADFRKARAGLSASAIVAAGGRSERRRSRGDHCAGRHIHQLWSDACQRPNARDTGRIADDRRAQTAKERWRRQLQTVDQQVDQLIVGPDINGDGWRDIFAATLFGRDVHVRPPQLFVDAISGRNGQPLWHSARPIHGNMALEEVFIDVLNWWSAGPDGWPQLVVSVRHGGSLGEPIVLACFSAWSGRVTHESTTLDPPLVADGDGDGADDLFCFAPRTGRQPTAAASCSAFASLAARLAASGGTVASGTRLRRRRLRRRGRHERAGDSRRTTNRCSFRLHGP